MLGKLHHSNTADIGLSTDLIPLTLAVMTLEQTLVIRDAVLAEDESVFENKVSARCNRIESSNGIDIRQLSYRDRIDECAIGPQQLELGREIAQIAEGRHTPPFWERCDTF